MGPSEKLEKILGFVRIFIPKKLFKSLQPLYHYFLATVGAFVYGFPSKKLFVIGVTGTKGKTSTVELVNAILEKANYKTAFLSTVRFKIDEKNFDNKHKMTTIGRFFTQRFLRKARSAGCSHAILELSSEASILYRHLFLNLNALIFTNLEPEHIESHGSFENYKKAKLDIGREFEKSKKENKVLIVNGDDEVGKDFLKLNIKEKYIYNLEDAEPFTLSEEGLEMSIENLKISSPLIGKFNVYNILAAVTFAQSQKIEIEIIKAAIEQFHGIKGRLEKVEAGQDFPVIIDYAHTSGSLEQVYQAFPHRDKICVLGNTGGGRDKWKRPKMATIANHYCSKIVLTNEDPYDEDPMQILNDMAGAIDSDKYEIELDRRTAIAKALKKAEKHSIVLITGKGSDPFIMGPNKSKTPWSDVEVTREEIKKLMNKKQ